MRKDQVVEATFDSLETDFFAKMGTVFADIVDIQHGIAAGVLLAPVIFTVTAAAVHHEHRSVQVKPLLDAFVSQVNGAKPPQIDRKTAGNLEQGVVHPLAIVIPQQASVVVDVLAAGNNHVREPRTDCRKQRDGKAPHRPDVVHLEERTVEDNRRDSGTVPAVGSIKTCDKSPGAVPHDNEGGSFPFDTVNDRDGGIQLRIVFRNVAELA